MVTLLLVDEPLVRRGLRMWLDRAADIKVIGEASNEAEAVVLAQALHPDVVLMNIPMLMQKHCIGSRAIAHSRGREETVRPQVSWRSSAAMK